MHFKGFFFFYMNPVALRQFVYNFGLSECNRVKRKQKLVLSKDIKIIFFLQYFLIFLTVKSRYTVYAF